MADTHDFGDGKGEVPAHRHPEGRGWVSDEATVDPQAWVGEGACVFGAVVVEGKAIIGGEARVYPARR